MDLSSRKDEYVGRIKEAAGVLVDNDGWKQSGRRDQSAARIKAASSDVKRKVDDVTDKVVKKTKQQTERAKDHKG